MTIPQSPEGTLDTANVTAKQVQDFHRNADTDTSVFGIHHSIGLGPNQASSGSHTHDGKGSKKLPGYVVNDAPVAVTGSRGGNVALANLLTVLASKGIITDSTSA